MISKQRKKNKGTIGAWLLNVTLFVSLFTYSEYTASNQQQRQVTKTELIVFGNPTSKRIVSYKKALALCDKNKVISELGRRAFQLSLLHHAALIKTTLDNTLNELLSFEKPNIFFKIKHTPHSSDEDIFNSLRG